MKSLPRESPEREANRRTRKTTITPTRAAISSQNNICEVCAIQENSSPNHLSQRGKLEGLRGFASSLESQTRRVTVLLLARFGSALTASTARSTCSRLGASPAGNAGVVAASNRISARPGKSGRKRTAKFLLDVPGLELGAAIEVHAKARRHVERFDEQHGHQVTRRGIELQRGARVALEDACEGIVLAGRREPVHQRKQPDRDRGFGGRECTGHHEGGATAAAAQLRDAAAELPERMALELVDRLR